MKIKYIYYKLIVYICTKIIVFNICYSLKHKTKAKTFNKNKDHIKNSFESEVEYSNNNSNNNDNDNKTSNDFCIKYLKFYSISAINSEYKNNINHFKQLSLYEKRILKDIFKPDIPNGFIENNTFDIEISNYQNKLITMSSKINSNNEIVTDVLKREELSYKLCNSKYYFHLVIAYNQLIVSDSVNQEYSNIMESLMFKNFVNNTNTNTNYNNNNNTEYFKNYTGLKLNDFDLIKENKILVLDDFNEGYCILLYYSNNYNYIFCFDLYNERKEFLFSLNKAYKLYIESINNKSKKKVDGFWVVTYDWSNCSSNCGEGVSTLKRMCNAPKNGGKPCQGNSIINKKCFDYSNCTLSTTNKEILNSLNNKNSTIIDTINNINNDSVINKSINNNNLLYNNTRFNQKSYKIENIKKEISNRLLKIKKFEDINIYISKENKDFNIKDRKYVNNSTIKNFLNIVEDKDILNCKISEKTNFIYNYCSFRFKNKNQDFDNCCKENNFCNICCSLESDTDDFSKDICINNICTIDKSLNKNNYLWKGIDV